MLHSAYTAYDSMLLMLAEYAVKCLTERKNNLGSPAQVTLYCLLEDGPLQRSSATSGCNTSENVV